MSTMQQKREFLSRILYDDQAWTLPDERIIAGYAAYHREPAWEDRWIEYEDFKSYEDTLTLDSQLGADTVDSMTEYERKKAEAKLVVAEREYHRLIAKSKSKRDVQRTIPLKHLDTPASVSLALRDSLYVCYFFYGAEDELLYVGKTNNFFTRWSDHVKTKDIAQVARVELHTFESSPDVLFYETQMILERQPKWNVQGKSGHKSKFSIEPLAVLHIMAKELEEVA
jgi:hypothetical protein